MNKRNIFTVICAMFVVFSFAVNYEVIYEQYGNDKKEEQRSYLFENKIGGIKSEGSEAVFIDYNENKIIKILESDGKFYKKSSEFSSFGEPELSDEKETILGFECRKAVYNLFSNKLEVWYTTETEAKGSPIFTGFPPNSLVLKLIYNGGFTLQAVEIKEYESPELNFTGGKAKELADAEYEKKLIDSRFLRLNIFDKEQINFGDEIEVRNDEITDLTYRFSKGTVVMKKINLPEKYKGGNVFIKLTTWSNGDAYDRTGSVFTVSGRNGKNILDAFRRGTEELPVYRDVDDKEYQGISFTGDYLPPIELMRFFTTFGVGHFNDKVNIAGYAWSDSVIFKQEITDLIDWEKDMQIGVFIGNYDKGGHKISLEMDFYPPYPGSEAAKNFVFPLFNTVNVLEMSGQNYGRLFKKDKLTVDFELPENIENTQLRFISTGHGGWGTGDEFVKRINRIIIDGKEIFKIIPWREDCGTYRLNNPASGNFPSGLSSSDLSRSNWCPGTITSPYYIPLEGLTPGKHTLEVDIDQGEDTESGFSFWNVSGVLIGTEK
ncbi:MAG: peptide-N-glycosidase [Candidatus Cloacimonadota bacterium]|nr:MAG: peptide-N-glycosidase [Candidatus Cloacimonadota bacterium]